MAKPGKRLIVVRFRRDRGMWEVDYRDQHGRRRRPLFATEADALENAAKRREELEKAAPVDETNFTLREYAAQWLNTVRPELEPATWQSYDRLLRCHVLPALGGFRLRELARRRIKALLTGMRQAGYASNTVRLVKAALSTMLTDTADDDLLEANPLLQLGRTKKRRAGLLKPAERQQRIRPMTWAHLDAFLTALATEPPRTAALLELAVKTGLRPGELGVLRIEDLDLRERTIRVERSWSRPDGRIKPTKTYEVRTVELSAGLARTLQRYGARLRADSLKSGTGAPEWLFPTATGRPLDEWQVGAAFHRVCRRAGLVGFRPYDCRHTYASGLLSLGAPVLHVQQQLGHAKPLTTWRHYASWIPTAIRWAPRPGQRWADALDSPAIWNQKLEPESGDVQQGLEKIGRGDWI